MKSKRNFEQKWNNWWVKLFVVVLLISLSAAIKEDLKPSSDFLKKSQEEILKANVLLGLILDKMEEVLA